MENNVIADNGARREPAKPSFRLTGDITARTFEKDLGKEDLTGMVVRIGRQWSVVKSNNSSSVMIWGKITDEAVRFEILDHYVAEK